MNSDKYQTITLVTRDGRRLTYTGRAQLQGNDKIIEIVASTPKALPKGMMWDPLEGDAETGDSK